MIKDLIKLANHLDGKGLTKEADTLDNIIRKIAQDDIKRIGKRGIDAICKFLSMAFGGTVTVDENYNEYNYNSLETVENEQGAFPKNQFSSIESSTYKLVGCDKRCLGHMAKSKVPTGIGNGYFESHMEDDGTLTMRYSSGKENFKIKVEKQDDGKTLLCTAEIE